VVVQLDTVDLNRLAAILIGANPALFVVDRGYIRAAVAPRGVLDAGVDKTVGAPAALPVGTGLIGRQGWEGGELGKATEQAEAGR
jgi:hypothetical protein